MISKLIVGCTLLLMMTSLQAAEVHSFKVFKQDERFYLDSDVTVAASTPSVYAVLTDFDQLHRLSTKIVESRLLEETESGMVVVYTRNKGCVVLYCTTVEKTELLEIEPINHITATADPERSNVKYSKTEWALTPENDSTRIHYTIEIEPDFWIPPVIGTPVFKSFLRRGGERVLDRIETYAQELDES